MDVMEVMKDYTCPICMEIAPKCTILKTCSHKFCADCQKNIEKSYPLVHSPYLNFDLDVLFVDKNSQKLILKNKMIPKK